jgi:hypothetical protein
MTVNIHVYNVFIIMKSFLLWRAGYFEVKPTMANALITVCNKQHSTESAKGSGRDNGQGWKHAHGLAYFRCSENSLITLKKDINFSNA